MTRVRPTLSESFRVPVRSRNKIKRGQPRKRSRWREPAAALFPLAPLHAGGSQIHRQAQSPGTPFSGPVGSGQA